jgi:hypothetical protein
MGAKHRSRIVEIKWCPTLGTAKTDQTAKTVPAGLAARRIWNQTPWHPNSSFGDTLRFGAKPRTAAWPKEYDQEAWNSHRPYDDDERIKRVVNVEVQHSIPRSVAILPERGAARRMSRQSALQL